MSTPQEIVQAWHDALNRGNVDDMAGLVHQEVEIGGPNGITSGVQIMRKWFGRANIRLYPLSYFANSQTIIVEEKAEWIDSTTRQVNGTQTVATVFRVADGLITSIIRYDPL